MHVPLYVLCIILTLLNFINSYQQSTEYVHVYNNDNQISTTNILSEITNIPNLSSCSAMCRKLADSVSFFYNSAIRKCVCTRQVQQSDLLPFVGYLYFSSSDISLWKVFGKSQYLHIKEKMKWLDAQFECQKLGAKLAEIKTVQENTFLKKYAKENDYGTAFIGGKDAFSQNRWRWSTTFKPVTDNGWAPGKPDTSAGDECLALNANHEMSWDDYECDRSFSFICERIMA